ncbi:two-component sensor histidine kinase [Enterococcus florum]|uniref:histidine kinase n=1 Tax=Enterococcus florum TaxID=2480627 RepID=A0A4P5P4Y8_9ENTE|nr:sensor histidine kinase [Enterococcus florum]GCF92887.1 two-component sensor histidine kinase [Enterococcus florum]
MKHTSYWFDYAFLLLLGALFLSENSFAAQDVFYVLMSLLFLAPILFLPAQIGTWTSFLLQFFSSMIWMKFFFFLPAMLRIFYREKKPYEQIVFIFLLAFFFQELSVSLKTILFSLSIAAIYLCLKDRLMFQLNKDLLDLKDDSWEKQELLKEQNAELVRTRENFLDLQVAEERNRIARDIHDNVGHLLSSALIQLGAIEAVNQDMTVQKLLEQLKVTVHAGMDNIRKSVHGLHSDSLKLEKAVQLMIEEFQFCPILVEGQIPQQLTSEQETMIAAIIKEALSNVMKHSQATQVRLIFDELPAFYRLKIIDNGKTTTQSKGFSNGIGLASMRQRSQKINGQLHISHSAKGFQINLILPKEESHDTCRDRR